MPFVIFAKSYKIMQVVSAREFRSNQGKYLNAAMRGQSVMLTSRYGNFKIMPVTEEDNLISNISTGLKEAMLMEEGKLPRQTLSDLLDEL